MPTPSALAILSVVRDLLRENNRAAIAANPQLAWALPELEAHESSLDDLIGRMPRGDDAIKAIREALAAADTVHDDAHRFIYYTLTAGQHRGPADARADAARALAALYPSGLSGIQVGYQSEVNSGQHFIKRVAEPEVAAALASQPETIAGAVADVRAAIETLREQLARLGDAEAVQSATPLTRELFHARNRAASTIATLSQNIEHAFRDADVAASVVRERLLQAWRGAQAQAERTAAAGIADVDLFPADAGASTPTPA